MEVYYKIFPNLKDHKYRFKSCQIEWIVVLELLDCSITNENRQNIIDDQYASYRADKVKVVMIFNKFSPNPKSNMSSIKNDIFKQTTINYTVGSIIESDSFNENLEIVNTHGIHYYKSLLLAYQEQLLDTNGKHKYWHDNGQLLCNNNKFYQFDDKLVGSTDDKFANHLEKQVVDVIITKIHQNEPIKVLHEPIKEIKILPKEKIRCCCTFSILRLITKM